MKINDPQEFFCYCGTIMTSSWEDSERDSRLTLTCPSCGRTCKVVLTFVDKQPKVVYETDEGDGNAEFLTCICFLMILTLSIALRIYLS